MPYLLKYRILNKCVIIKSTLILTYVLTKNDEKARKFSNISNCLFNLLPAKTNLFCLDH